MDINSRRKNLNNNKKYLVLVVYVIIFSIISIYIIYKGIGFVKITEKVYINDSSIDYKVYLKENNYFDDDYLDKDKKYIASLIDTISINFDYKLNSNNKFSGNYAYNIVATLVVTEQGKDTILWSKDYNLTEVAKINFKDHRDIFVSDDTIINYDYYNNIVSSFKKDYAVPIDAYLMVKLGVQTEIVNAEDNIYEINDEPSLKIPLSEQTIEISMEESNNKEIVNRYSYVDKPFFHYTLIAVGIILFMLYLTIGINLLLKIIKNMNKKSKYDRFLNKIFNDYDQIIINVLTEPKKMTNELLLTKFEELIDAQIEIRKPIVFYEDVTNKRAIFVLNDGIQTFKYIVNESDFDK